MSETAAATQSSTTGQAAADLFRALDVIQSKRAALDTAFLEEARAIVTPKLEAARQSVSELDATRARLERENTERQAQNAAIRADTDRRQRDGEAQQQEVAAKIQSRLAELAQIEMERGIQQEATQQAKAERKVEDSGLRVARQRRTEIDAAVAAAEQRLAEITAQLAAAEATVAPARGR